jgi:hypothetical protein
MNTEEQIKEILKEYPTMSYKDIAKKIGCSKSTIQYYFNKLGIYRDRVAQQKLNNTDRNHPIILTDIAKSILIGTLLGDSSITKYNRNCEAVKILNSTITCGHSYKQREYTLYLKSLLEKEGLKVNYTENPEAFTHVIGNRTCVCNGRCDIRISRSITFNYWRDLWYPNNKKVVPTNIKEHFTALSLAIWFMDDGSKNNCSYYLHTEGFNIEDVIFLQKLLLDKFGIHSSINMMKNKPTIYILAKSRELFTNIIKPYICESMRYKLIE